MKLRIPTLPAWIVAVAVLIHFSVLFTVGLPEALYAEEPAAAAPAEPAPEKPAAEAPAEKPAEKADADKAEEYDWKIGDKLDGDTITKLIQLGAEAAQNKGSFWRNPALWELFLGIVLLVLGLLAAKFGWKKKKWGKIIVAIQTAVQTIYMEWVRDAKIKAKEAGGKLSKEDMLKALNEAWDLTKQDLMNQGIDLAKWITKEYFGSLVNAIIQKAKKKE